MLKLHSRPEYRVVSILLAGIALALPFTQAVALAQSNQAKLPKVPVGAVAAQVTGRLVGGAQRHGEPRCPV